MNTLSDKPIANIHGTAKHGSYAHFPGSYSGPAATCKQCNFLEKITKGKHDGGGRCQKWKQMMKGPGNPDPKPTPISGGSLACKYFEKDPNVRVSKMGVQISE